ncbi:hypothetical protein KVT40_007758 [Elsinoe batatas]|uniref:Uncharacterized protein n=1 Tax=Elsinoe batatas TaxID=2601811 RepID=A0A8K0PCK8_9PEZI|nr:hypothetical protein KVT40_007758 [Elsinoe batatas]
MRRKQKKSILYPPGTQGPLLIFIRDRDLYALRLVGRTQTVHGDRYRAATLRNEKSENGAGRNRSGRSLLSLLTLRSSEILGPSCKVKIFLEEREDHSIIPLSRMAAKPRKSAKVRSRAWNANRLRRRAGVVTKGMYFLIAITKDEGGGDSESAKPDHTGDDLRLERSDPVDGSTISTVSHPPCPLPAWGLGRDPEPVMTETDRTALTDTPGKPHFVH